MTAEPALVCWSSTQDVSSAQIILMFNLNTKLFHSKSSFFATINLHDCEGYIYIYIWYINTREPEWTEAGSIGLLGKVT